MLDHRTASGLATYGLKGGVTLKVHAYVKGVKEYGKAPAF